MIANPIQIKMPRPHGGQFKMLDCLARGISVVAFCGRRFGKTQVSVYGILRAATQTVGLYWWVGLELAQCVAEACMAAAEDVRPANLASVRCEEGG